MLLTSLWLFFVCVLAILATPGPTNTLLWSSGALHGLRASLHLLLAEITGYLLSISAMRVLGEPLFKSEPLFGTLLKLAVAAYLVLQAWRLWRNPQASPQTSPRSVGLRQVFTTTLLNPKSAVFAFGVLPPFSDAAGALPYFLIFITTVPFIGSLWIILGHSVRATRMGMPALRRLSAAALCAIAALLTGSAILS